MNNVTKFFRKYFLDWLPSPLPRGMSEFQTWSKAIIDTYDLPDNDSVRFMLGAVILQLGPTGANKPRRYFGLCGLTAASKEIAHATLTQLKTAQEAKDKAAKAALTGNPSEATVIPINASNVAPISTPPNAS